MGNVASRSGEKGSIKIVRVVIATMLIGVSIWLFIRMFNNASNRDRDNSVGSSTVAATFFTPRDFLKQGFFYTNGDGSFDIDRSDGIISIRPFDDFFVSMSHQEYLADRVVEHIELSFEYRYTRSTVKNPQKHGGVVIILISKNGYRTLHNTWPLCRTVSADWKPCTLTIDDPGELRAMIIRFGGTSYYKVLRFRSARLKMSIRGEPLTNADSQKAVNGADTETPDSDSRGG